MGDTTANDFECMTLDGVIEAAKPILEEVLASADKPLSADACSVMAELLQRLMTGAKYLVQYKDRWSPPWLLYDIASDVLTIDGIRFSHDLFRHIAASNLYFRIVARENGTVTIEQTQTEGALAAAAPELLDALEQALDDMGVEGHCVCEATKQQMRAAIAKAQETPR